MKIATFALMVGVCSVVAAQPQDYGKGFEQLRQFGLPDVAGAKRVEVSLVCPDFPGLSMPNPYERNNRAWLLPGGKDGNGEMILCEAWRVKVKKAGTATTDALFAGTWEEVDFQAEVLWLAKTVEAAKDDGAQEWWLQRDFPHLFLIAAQAHRLGFKDESNRLAAALFSLDYAPQDVVTAGLGQLATGKYCELYFQSLRDGNLQAFARGVDALLEKRPAGWIFAQAVEERGGWLARKLKGDVAEISGDDLDDSDRSLAKELADAWGGFLPSAPVFWLFPPPGQRPAPAPPGVLYKLVDRRWQSLSLLLALYDDSCLTGIGRQTDGFELFSGRPPSTPDVKVLPGLATRGEVAKFYLSTVLPQQNYSAKLSDEDKLGELRSWWRENKGKTLRQLAMLYWEDGDQEQRRGSLQFLLRSSTDAELEELEATLLNELFDDSRDISLALSYCEGRGLKAQGFVEKFVNRFALLHGGSVGLIKFQYFYAVLQAAVSSRPLDELLAGLTSGKLKWDFLVECEVKRQLKLDEHPDPLSLVLGLVTQGPNVERRLSLLLFLDQWNIKGERGESPLFVTHAALWDKISAAATDKDDARFVRQWIVQLYAPDKWDYGLSGRLGERLTKRYEQEIIDALRAGKPLPATPDAANVNASRRLELAKAIESPATLAANVGKLSYDEALALGGILAKDKALNAKCLPYVNTIVAVELDSELQGKLDSLKALRGQQFSSRTVDAILQAIRDNPLLTVHYWINRDGCLGGTKVGARVYVKSATAGLKVPGIHKVLTGMLKNQAFFAQGVLGAFSVELRDGKEDVKPIADNGIVLEPGMCGREECYRKLDRALTKAPASARISVNIALWKALPPGARK